MQYPLISEYVRAIQDASNNLDELAHLVPVQDDHGEPYRSSGAFAVVFKMKDEQTGKYYALKCFTEEQKGRAESYRQIADELEFVDSPYLTSVKYLEKEIFVDSSCEEDEFPVLLMDWIDGETMENYIAENYQDNYAMAMLCYRFCKMAAWGASLAVSALRIMRYYLYFPCQRPLPESAQLLAHCSFARQSQCICALHLSCRYCERPLYTILSIIFTFFLPIKIRMS